MITYAAKLSRYLDLCKYYRSIHECKSIQADPIKSSAALRNAVYFVILAPHVEVPLAVPDVANLLILVKVLMEEHLHFVLVGGAHVGRGHDDLIAVLIASLLRQLVDTVKLTDPEILDAEPLQCIDIDGIPRVVRQALVTL